MHSGGMGQSPVENAFAKLSSQSDERRAKVGVEAEDVAETEAGPEGRLVFLLLVLVVQPMVVLLVVELLVLLLLMLVFLLPRLLLLLLLVVVVVGVLLLLLLASLLASLGVHSTG